MNTLKKQKMIDVKDITNFTVGLQTGMLPITQRKKFKHSLSHYIVNI